MFVKKFFLTQISENQYMKKFNRFSFFMVKYSISTDCLQLILDMTFFVVYRNILSVLFINENEQTFYAGRCRNAELQIRGSI